MMIKLYSEVIKLYTFKERYNYLQLTGSVGENTFGYNRFVNQKFYQSREWRSIRDYIIIRDNGCDLGIDGYEIHGKIYIHHLNPILLRDFETQSKYLLDPEYLISTTHETHNAIHYGDEGLLILEPLERTANDTIPWRN